ncbi:YbaY family lipoprotein [Leptolyngbya sp. FACHB-36]|uniref:YbaY family lipoprotein n=1 Tax=Leptolyngbya sp. FACHB-36 TaxID=2692808 RepID=UPI001680C70F|nr:YbaY family lipoprotein [Leptolyngbya sp. FACHB-36]MBD2020610.1 YbaY family lipoprotein [Leptolyngbya sp. FACHB-36]
MANLSGTLTYPSTTRLPPDAVAYVTLVDVSPRQDTSGGMIARQILSNLGSAPVSFQMNYDRKKICADCSYAIQAQIVVKGKVLFRNASAYPVLTRGNPSIVNILLKPV